MDNLNPEDDWEMFEVSKDTIVEIVNSYRKYSYDSVSDILKLYLEVEGYKFSIDEAVNKMIDKAQERIFQLIGKATSS